MRHAFVIVIALLGCGKHSNNKTDAPTPDSTPAIDAAIDAMPSTAACTSYCNAIQTTCTGGLVQYASTDSCIASCLLLPGGATGASSGDSPACRVTHLQLALADPTTHCVHAGPSGGAACGTPCPALRDRASQACPPGYPAAACTAGRT